MRAFTAQDTPALSLLIANTSYDLDGDGHLGDFPTFKLRSVSVPVIALVRTLGGHDVAQMMILPDGPDADALLRHIEFVDALAQRRTRTAAHNTSGQVPTQADVDAESIFVRSTAAKIRDEAVVANFDDSYFRDDDGDPNQKDSHAFGAVCAYLKAYSSTAVQTYTVIVSWMRYALVTNTSGYKIAQHLLAVADAAPEDRASVGWTPIGTWTYWIKGVRPTLAGAYLANDPGKGELLVLSAAQPVVFSATPFYLPMPGSETGTGS